MTTASPTNTLRLTRGAAYILEGLCQRHEPFGSKPRDIANASRLWCRLRAANPATDFEQTLVRSESESETAWQTRVQAQRALFKAWQNEDISLELRPRFLEVASTAVQWLMKNREKAPVENGPHLLSLITAFDLVENDDTE